MKTDFRIEGAADMERLLKTLGPEVANKVGRQAVRAGAAVIVAEAKRLVRVRTGDLRDAIAIKTEREAAGDREGKVTATIGFTRPVSRRAHLIEFGTSKMPAQPFMRPAMDGKAGAALDAMGKTLARGIDREARKLAKD